ncbi:ADP-ribosylation factor GTPase-activating protein 1 [Enteropsectra breve]|nr:ADP-ribosylation factor GTPase-activating protein 1 [Enteropsectra breve]
MGSENCKRILHSLMQREENRKCADCGEDNPKWVSLFYGAFVCLDCAGIHRSLGVLKDIIRSAELDKWDEKSLMPCKYGGNQKLRSYLIEKDMNGMSTAEKYSSKLACEYSEKLAALVYKETGIEMRHANSESNNKKIQKECVSASCPADNAAAEKSCTTNNYGMQSNNQNTSHMGRTAGGDMKNNVVKHAKAISTATLYYGKIVKTKILESASKLVSSGSEIFLKTKQSKESSKKTDSPSVSHSQNLQQNDWS